MSGGWAETGGDNPDGEVGVVAGSRKGREEERARALRAAGRVQGPVGAAVTLRD